MGEDVFWNMNCFFFWFKLFMIKRILEFFNEIFMIVMYGVGIFFDYRIVYEIKYVRQNFMVNVYIVGDVGYDIYVDNVDEFNRILRKIIGDIVDEGLLVVD